MPHINKIIRHLKSVKQCLKSQKHKDSWRDLKPCDVLLMAHEFDRSYLFERVLYSPVIDTTGWYITRYNPELTVQSLTLPFSDLAVHDAYGSPKSMNRAMFSAKIKAKLSRFLIPASARQCNPELKLWLDVLEVAKPKAVVAVQPHPYLCQACRLKGIKVFDYQHGLISDEMPEYGNKPRDVTLLPTGYLCWDEDSAHVLRPWATKLGIDVFVASNPWISRFAEQQSDDVLVLGELARLDENLKQVANHKRYQKTVLVSLQPDLDYHFSDYFRSDEFVPQAFIDVLEAHDEDVLWLVRLHPIQYRDSALRQKIIQFFSSYPNVHIEHATKAALPVVLAYSQGHLTWNSCVVLEASYMGIHSFIMDPRQADGADASPFFQHVEQAFLATRAQHTNCAQEINEWLTTLTPSKKAKPLMRFDAQQFIENIGISQNDQAKSAC